MLIIPEVLDLKTRLDLIAVDVTVELHFREGMPLLPREHIPQLSEVLHYACIPAFKHLQRHFMVALTNDKLCRLNHNLKWHLTAIRHKHIAEGVADPMIGNMPRLQQVLKGIKHCKQRREDPERNKGSQLHQRFWLELNEMGMGRGSTNDTTMSWAAALACCFSYLDS